MYCMLYMVSEQKQAAYVAGIMLLLDSEVIFQEETSYFWVNRAKELKHWGVSTASYMCCPRGLS